MDKLLSLKQVGALLGVKEKTVRSWVRLKKLRAFGPDRGWVWRVKESEIMRFIGEEEWQSEDIVAYIEHQLPGMFKKA